MLPYSSGTTGVPKGVKLTHRNLVSNMVQRNHPVMEGMDIGEVTVCILPMFHIFAMNVTMADMLWFGGKLVTLPMFEPRMFLAALTKHRPTFLHLAPPLVQFLAVHPMVTEDHLASLHTVIFLSQRKYIFYVFLCRFLSEQLLRVRRSSICFTRRLRMSGSARVTA